MIVLFSHLNKDLHFYIGFEELESGDKKDTSFIQHLALSMLPPFLPSIVDIKANWVPKGWSDGKELPKESLEGG